MIYQEAEKNDNGEGDIKEDMGARFFRHEAVYEDHKEMVSMYIIQYVLYIKLDSHVVRSHNMHVQYNILQNFSAHFYACIFKKSAWASRMV